MSQTLTWLNLLTRVRRAVKAFESGRTDTASTWTFSVRVREDTLDGGWIADCPALPGCMSEGDTTEEALHNISDAIAEVLSARVDLQLAQSVPEKNDEGTETRRVLIGA